MEPLLTRLLNLPGIIVEDFHETETELILEVEAWSEKATCPRCSTVSSHLHQNHGYLVRDLPISNRQVFLKVNRRQFKCKTCGKPFSESLEFVGRRRKYTERLALEIVKQVLHSDIHNVAHNHDLSDEEVSSMIHYVSKKKLKIDFTKLRRLGIDEIALLKGGKTFIVVLVDLDTGKPIAFAPSRQQRDISAVLESWGTQVLNQVREVSMDLCSNYKGLVSKLLPNADITVDRFHVMKLVNRELDEARKNVQKSQGKLASKAEQDLVKDALLQSKYVLLKSADSLKQEQQEKLSKVQAVSPLLHRMHKLKEDFRQIFETFENWADGTLKLLDWLKLAQTDFQESTRTIKRWFGEVVGYFERGTTNGVVEGINNKLKLIKRSGYGFRNFDNFQLRCLICWHLDGELA